MKRILLFIALLLVFVPVVSAHEGEEAMTQSGKMVVQPSAELIATSAPAPTPINTFEFFWPLSAGKTRADNLYFLKMWKENLRGLLIFGTAEKANYRVLRATKRMLEAEVLITSDKTDLATQTVSSSNNYLKMANDAMVGVTGSESIKSEMKNRLDKLIILVDQLSVKADGSLKEQISLNHSLIESLLKTINH